MAWRCSNMEAVGLTHDAQGMGLALLVWRAAALPLVGFFKKSRDDVSHQPHHRAHYQIKRGQDGLRFGKAEDQVETGNAVSLGENLLLGDGKRHVQSTALQCCMAARFSLPLAV